MLREASDPANAVLIPDEIVAAAASGAGFAAATFNATPDDIAKVVHAVVIRLKL